MNSEFSYKDGSWQLSFGECLKTYIREISGFFGGVVEAFDLLVCYKLLVYNYFPGCRGSILV